LNVDPDSFAPEVRRTYNEVLAQHALMQEKAAEDQK
jgi:hypothetical protein